MQEYVAYSHTGRIIPAIWFRYDLSPITVKYTERRQPLYRFITTVREPSGTLLGLRVPFAAGRWSKHAGINSGLVFLVVVVGKGGGGDQNSSHTPAAAKLVFGQRRVQTEVGQLGALHRPTDTNSSS